MRWLRIPLRLLAMLAVTALLWPGLLLANLAMPRRWPLPRRRRVQRFFYRRWAAALRRILGVRLEVEGEVPTEPCLLVTNHLSYVDVLVLAEIVPGRFVAKAEIRSWPLLGWLARSVDTLFVNRLTRRDVIRVGREIARGIAEGDTVILFPEGTSTRGHEVAPFKPALLAPAAEERMPVRFAALHYSTPADEPPAYESVCWWGEEPLFPHAPRLMALSRIECTVRFGDRSLSSDDRKELASELHAAIGGIFEPVVAWEPATAEHSAGDRALQPGDPADVLIGSDQERPAPTDRKGAQR